MLRYMRFNRTYLYSNPIKIFIQCKVVRDVEAGIGREKNIKKIFQKKLTSIFLQRQGKINVHFFLTHDNISA